MRVPTGIPVSRKKVKKIKPFQVKIAKFRNFFSLKCDEKKLTLNRKMVTIYPLAVKALTLTF